MSILWRDDHAKTRVMVGGVVTGLRLPQHLATTHNAPGPAITRTGCPDGVFTVVATDLPGQLPLAVAKNRPVLFVWKRTSLLDKSVGQLTFWRQRGQCNDRPVQGFRRQPGMHHSSAKQTSQPKKRQRQAPGSHGKSSHHETPFKSPGLTRTLKGASVMHCTKKSKGLPEKQASPYGLFGLTSERPLSPGALPSNGSRLDQRCALASATVRAVMLTMRRTVVLGVRMCTGLAAPRSTGPMAMLPPAAVLSRL